MKRFFLIVIICVVLCNCASPKTAIGNAPESTEKADTVRIANDSSTYELIIFDTGFHSFLAQQAPRGHYSQSYLESHNHRDVVCYNSRVTNPNYSPDLYPRQIDYDPGVDYGYEVNYLLYYYFRFFEQKYHQHL